MLRLLHTADWHLGRRFPSFPEEAQKKLSRARLEAVSRILDVGRRNAVDAVLCAGDLFDDAFPEDVFWQGLVRVFVNHAGPHVPAVLVPGNHDPLQDGSIWHPDHPFRAALPAWVHVVDRDDFELALPQGAILYARPCRSKAGEADLAMCLPARQPGDNRIRIGCVHGSTFDNPGCQTNFPIARDAAVRRGLDYLAIGDTHSFRDVTHDAPVPTVYPGTPEPTSFDEPGAGSVAIVALFRRGTRPRVQPEPVAFWTWMDVCCRNMNELRGLLATRDLDRAVVRLRLDMRVSLPEETEVERIIRDLQGTDATFGRAGILLVDRTGLVLERGSQQDFPSDLPQVFKDTVERLDRLVENASDDTERNTAIRARAHLYKMLQQHDAVTGRAQ